MTTVVTRLFDTYEHARQAVDELERTGISHDSISVVANNQGEKYNDANQYGATSGTAYGTDTVSGATPVERTEADTGAGTGATLGTILGGGAGLLAGLGMLAIPGVGPVVAAGWLIATLTGAGVGAASGGLLGGLVGAGVSEEDAHVYTEGVRRGGTLVTVRAEDADKARIEAVLTKYSPVDTASRGESYRAEGWTKFDDTAPAYTAGTTTAMGTPGTLGGTMADPTLPGTTVPPRV
jgi:uncharacterized protein YqgC (DUF456 family)